MKKPGSLPSWSWADINPELVQEAKLLRRRTKSGQRSLREIRRRPGKARLCQRTRRGVLTVLRRVNDGESAADGIERPIFLNGPCTITRPTFHRAAFRNLLLRSPQMGPVLWAAARTRSVRPARQISAVCGFVDIQRSRLEVCIYPSGHPKVKCQR
jgi:hypothetical protein